MKFNVKYGLFGAEISTSEQPIVLINFFDDGKRSVLGLSPLISSLQADADETNKRMTVSFSLGQHNESLTVQLP